MTSLYAVDIASDCKGQTFRVIRKDCFVTHRPIIMVEGMGLFQSYLDDGNTIDTDVIKQLLATVDCVPLAIRPCA